MNVLWISLAIGLVAGLLDIAPMVVQKMDRRAILSAFLQYLFLGVVIVNIDLPGVVWWLEGCLISLALALPVLVIVSQNDKKAIPIIASMAVVLGTGISIAGHYLAPRV